MSSEDLDSLHDIWVKFLNTKNTDVSIEVIKIYSHITDIAFEFSLILDIYIYVITQILYYSKPKTIYNVYRILYLSIII